MAKFGLDSLIAYIFKSIQGHFIALIPPLRKFCLALLSPLVYIEYKVLAGMLKSSPRLNLDGSMLL